ncbi:MAG: glycosyltransferase family 39 protein [Ignavibacteriota bacterium]|nr:glycosyltransferase family 39 protein [Ignavibacteriota bacterium]
MINKNLKIIKDISAKILSNDYLILLILIALKFGFQLMIIGSGYKWLSSDDYCRTVKSFEWHENPIIYSGVWLTPHFWINGVVMVFIKDLYLAATTTNILFSTATTYFFYKLALIVFDKKSAILSTLIFIFFPFQVWLSISGLPESIHFFFIIAGIYYAVLYKKENGSYRALILATVMFAFGNMFRYEGWLFSIIFVTYIGYTELILKKGADKNYRAFFVSTIALSTILWWLLRNLADNGSMMYFASETNKIYEDYGGIKVLQKVVQYPVFIFYIAPITSFFALKVSYDCISGFLKKKTDVTLLSIFAFFNIAELVLLMLQGLFGTGGTNMISRYIVINAILFIPMAVWQIFNFRKWLAVSFFSAIILGNLIWSFYYPQPFREDTYETGRLIRDRVEKNYVKKDDKVYFEEVEGYYDIYAVQTISNNPSKFLLGNFPLARKEESKKRKKKEPTLEELNILDIKSYLEKNKIALAVVKSDSYSEKLKKLNLKSEEVGDYKIFYVRDLEANISDSSITVMSDKIIDLKKNKNIISFNRMLTIKEFSIDNSNFGFNPQTVSITWASTTKGILDSIDYDNYDFDRYSTVLEIRREDNDSLVYSESKKIFSDRNVEDLISYNEVRNILVLKPFALIYYSRKFTSSPFESGVYNLSLMVFDDKLQKSLTLYRGDSLYTIADKKSDTVKTTSSDTVKTKPKVSEKVKMITTDDFVLGSIIAFFPNTNIDKVVSSNGANFYRVITRNGLQVFFSQRYQADHFLNFVFNYF